MKKMVSIVLTIMMVLSMSANVLAVTVPSIGSNINSGLSGIGSNVLGYVQWFGYALAVGMLLYIGIKYMMASANEKADLKKGSINYVIGAILVAAASTIVGMFTNIAGEVTSGADASASGAPTLP